MNDFVIKKLFLLLLLLLPITQVMAGLSITPAFVRMDKAQQGIKYIIPIEVSNQSAKKTEYFKADIETPTEMINGTPAATIIGWTKVSPKAFTLQPGETRKVKVSVRVPKGYIGDYRIYLSIRQDPRKYKLKLNTQKLKQSIGVMQFGKTSTRIPEFKTHVKALIKINIPIVLRALKKGQKIKTNSKKIKLGKIKVNPSRDKRNAMTLSIPVLNKHRFDIVVTGSCTILDAKGLKKLKVAGIKKRINMQPKTKSTIECDFKSPLPKGKYQVRGNFLSSIKGIASAVKITPRQKIKINSELAKKIAAQGDTSGSDRPLTPLMISPSIIEQEFTGGSVRQTIVEVVNPTTQKLDVFAKFKSSNKKKVKVVISPKKIKLAPGATERIKLNFKPKNKKAPVFGWLSFEAKQTKGSIPATIPVILIPEGTELKQKLRLGKVKVNLSGDQSFINISTAMKNSKKGAPALFLKAQFIFTNIKAGGAKSPEIVRARLSNNVSLPGDTIRLVGGLNFHKLKDGVYKLKVTVTSEEGGVDLTKTIRVVINRDIDNKVKVVE